MISAESPLKGEIVVLAGPPQARAAASAEAQADVDAKLGKALESLSVKDAAAVVSAETGQPRRKVYARALELAVRPR
jgi:16S rRNA (cytidine1402-2'-O)-methyltransferase